MTMNDKKLSDEFNQFLSAAAITPPAELSQSLFSFVHADLNPPSGTVFLKMLGIHTVVSVFSLSICSQFGVRAFGVFDAMESMMSLVGRTYCMAFCGLLYLSVSALALSLLLKPEEIKVIRRHRFLQLTLLSGLSLGVFLCLGATVLLIPGMLWVAGSIIGGVSMLEVGWWLRARFRQQLIFGT